MSGSLDVAKAARKKLSRRVMRHRSVVSVGIELDDDGAYVIAVGVNPSRWGSGPALPAEIDGVRVRVVRSSEATVHSVRS